MVSVSEASTIVLSNLFKPSIETVSFQDAIHKVLAERVVADRDFPPFDRVSMDGIAILFSDWDAGQREFVIENVQAAGEERKVLTGPGKCLEVMTGAVLPANTDTVIRYEDLEINKGSATVSATSIVKRQNIHGKGKDATQGNVLLESGIVLSPAEIALLAAVGKSNVKVFSFPRTAIIASGDELVEVSATPLPHQIRRSNTFAIQAAMKTLGWNGDTFHLEDNKELMLSAMKDIIQSYQVIILSGGVSKGKFDFVPAVLEEIGVRKLFHRVNQRPGKPFWFGNSENGTTVFALPGNPVSTYMCFYRYIKPWLLNSVGVKSADDVSILARDFSFPDKLTYFLQVAVKNENGNLMAYPDAGGGSGDFANLKNVTGFLELPEEQSNFAAGDVFSYLPFRDPL
jgi:molybdopterin molybdotransferase